MILRINSSAPTILAPDMLLQCPSLSLTLVKVLPIRTARHSIVVPEQPSTSKFRKQKFDHVDEGTRFDCVCDVESIDISFSDPALELVSDLGGSSYNGGTEASDGKMTGDGGFGPFGNAGNGVGPGFDC